MPKWTDSQSLAIEKSNTNIIVSAGAGSGKTAVLTERVIQNLKKGWNINELLILTFTSAAAGEMKERIRSKIEKDDSIKNNLDYLGTSYITTFDSYTLSLVKKYHYLLNLDKDINIVDNNFIDIIKENLLTEVFEEFYEEKDEKFLKLINDFCIKDDTNIKKSILGIIKSLELIFDKEEFYNKDYTNNINEYIKDYLNILYEIIKEIETSIYILSESSFPEYYDQIVKFFQNLINSKSYDDIKKYSDVSIPRRPKNSDEIKDIKDSIDESLKNLKGYLRYKDEEEIRKSFEISKEYIDIIIKIIKRYDEKINNYKYLNNAYEFNDIEMMAISIIKNNNEIKNEIKNNFKEIMVDEYQDTNDLQELFVSLISNNNVYMVGDIKQSIYGFRNANPLIFKNKYDKYSRDDDGFKIDLLNNFRSRKEVLDGINTIFNLIMDDNIGGANYIKEHQMIFGNLVYEENQKENNDLEILNYNFEKGIYSKDEYEAFIIANDIIKKIKDKYQVIDKKSNILRDINYNDFCIIMDRNTSFFLYKKIFEYMHIPLVLYVDNKLTENIDVNIICNILGICIKIKNKEYDAYFRYMFLSVARSFLENNSDYDIFEMFNNNNFYENEIYIKCKEISKKLDILSTEEILKLIINKFNYYENLIKLGNIFDGFEKINNLYKIANNLSQMGYSVIDYYEYLKNALEGSNITYKNSNNDANGVKIMNIHKSKGLEFPICYFSGFHKAFNTSDIKERFIYSKDYGIITPYFNEGIGSLITKDLLKEKYNIENISEKIRLLYVALTRAKEKMIIVTSLDENYNYVNNHVDLSIKKKYKSFLDIINSISGNLKKYIHNVEVTNLSKDYLLINKNKLLNSNDTRNINYINLIIENDDINNNKASKKIDKIIDINEYKKMEYGTSIHELLEENDFFNISKDNKYFDIINNLVSSLDIKKTSILYKEHEFIYNDNNNVIHGIIDLIIEDEDIIKIVDYKLKQIVDDNYKKQVNIYINYLKERTNKKVEGYLYSIIDNKLFRI